MAITTLFAPQVPTVQPAFVNTGEVKIYFSLSAYNKINDITSVRYTLIDPNQKSTWGTNSLFINSSFDNNLNVYYQEISITNVNYDSKKKQYYIQVDFSKMNLLPEQYYQSQLYFIGSDNSYSPLSQVTLIRYFNGFESIHIEGLEGNTLYSLNKLKGYVVPKDPKSVEYIKTYSYQILQGTAVLDESLKIGNTLGFQFETDINYIFEPNQNYKLIFNYTTINEYTDSQTYDFTVVEMAPTKGVWDSGNENHLDIDFLTITDMGGVDINMKWNSPQLDYNSKIIIQRSTEKDNFLNWQDMVEFKCQPLAQGTYYFTWRDCFLEGNIVYRYRFLFWQLAEEELNVRPDLMTEKVYEYEATDFEHIYLSDQDTMLVVQYNPNITNFKWVTQESITNTLGGTFPVIRQNGDTKYRQFSLSGTLYFNFNSSFGTDSKNTDMSQWFQEENCGLYLSEDNYNTFISSNRKNSNLQQRRAREYTMNFLTNRKPKLFRSREEGNMIVYLSNISFTPNKTLDRQVWDFSATVTEICEATEENMKKYNFNIQNNGIYSYTLSVKEIEINDDNLYTAYIDAAQFINNTTVKLSAEEVGYIV